MAVPTNIPLLYPRLASLSEAALQASYDAATEWVKKTLGRDLNSGSKTQTLSGRNRPVLWLKNTPVTAITSVTVNGTVLASSDYRWEPSGKVTRATQGFISQMQGWDPGAGNIVIVYTSSGIPQIAQDDIIGSVMAWMQDAARISGLASSERIGNYQYVANTAFASRIPASVMSKMSPYVSMVS